MRRLVSGTMNCCNSKGSRGEEEDGGRMKRWGCEETEMERPMVEGRSSQSLIVGVSLAFWRLHLDLRGTGTM